MYALCFLPWFYYRNTVALAVLGERSYGVTELGVRGGGGKFKSRAGRSQLFSQVDGGTVRPGADDRGSERWLESGCNVKVEPTGLADALGMGSKRKKCQKRLLILQLRSRMVLFRGLTERELAAMFSEVGGYAPRICKIALASFFLLVFSSQNCDARACPVAFCGFSKDL